MLCWNLKFTVLESLQVVNKLGATHFKCRNLSPTPYMLYCKLFYHPIHRCHSSLIMNHDYFTRCSIRIPAEEDQGTK